MKRSKFPQYAGTKSEWILGKRSGSYDREVAITWDTKGRLDSIEIGIMSRSLNFKEATALVRVLREHGGIV